MRAKQVPSPNLSLSKPRYITVPPVRTKTVTAYVNHPTEWHTTGTVTSVGKLTEAASLLLSDSMSTIVDKKTAVKITNTTEATCSSKKNAQTAEFSVVTPEQPKFIKPVDTAVLSMSPEGDPDLTTHLTQLLKTKQPEQQNKTFQFPAPKKLGKIERHTTIQTGIPRELCEMREKEKLNPRDVGSRMTFLEQFYWTLCSRKPRNEQLILFYLSTIKFLSDKEWTLG